MGNAAETARVEIFVHHQCPHCADVIAQYAADPEQFGGAEMLDVTDIRNLKRFLTYRDALDGYAQIKAAGKIGVPSKVIGGQHVEFFDQV